MTVPIIEAPIRHWHCPSCGVRDQTQRVEVYTQFHDCPAFAGAGIPLIEVAGPSEEARGRHVPVMGEHATAGLVMASIRTEREDGTNDCTIFPAPGHQHI